MEKFNVIAENVVGAIIKQACQGVEDRLGVQSCLLLAKWMNDCFQTASTIQRMIHGRLMKNLRTRTQDTQY